MNRIYFARCPLCPIAVAADELKGPWGNDCGMVLLDHINQMHPELVYTEREYQKLHYDRLRNN